MKARPPLGKPGRNPGRGGIPEPIGPPLSPWRAGAVSAVRVRSRLGSRACTVASNMSVRFRTCALYSRVHPSARRAHVSYASRRYVLLIGSRLRLGGIEPRGRDEPCAGATIRTMPMRDRRPAHVRPKPPDSARLDRGRAQRTFAPQQNVPRRYRPLRTGPQIPAPIMLAIVAGGLVLGLITVTVGTSMVTGLIGQIAGAFNGAVTRLSSQGPATPPPSGATLDTPVLDVPSNDGYTSQV